jgi:hypothetical protein
VEPSGAAGGKRKKSKCGSSTGALENKKRKNEGGGTLAKKHSRLLDTVLAPPPVPSPLRSKGDLRTKWRNQVETVRQRREAPLLRL